jgi:hypothetical protein
MNTTTNLLFMFMPEKYVGVMLLAMIVAGGFCYIVGLRQQGQTLVMTAIAFPIITVIISALMNDSFAIMPEWMVTPVAFLIMAVIYLAVAWIIVKAVLGQRVIDHIKAELVLGAIRSGTRLMFSKVGLVILTVVLAFSYMSIFLA